MPGGSPRALLKSGKCLRLRSCSDCLLSFVATLWLVRSSCSIISRPSVRRSSHLTMSRQLKALLSARRSVLPHRPHGTFTYRGLSLRMACTSHLRKRFTCGTPNEGTVQLRDLYSTAAMAVRPQSSPLPCCGNCTAPFHIHCSAVCCSSSVTRMPMRRRLLVSAAVRGSLSVWCGARRRSRCLKVRRIARVLSCSTGSESQIESCCRAEASKMAHVRMKARACSAVVACASASQMLIDATRG